MIGNDIVDRAQAHRESNWQRRGFLEKLFTIHEQKLILTADDPERIVWLLWSIKESAYKASFRETGKRIFAPRKLACQIISISDETAEGVVFYEKIYQTKSLITPQYIASTATSANTSSSLHQTIIPFEKATYQDQHLLIREKIKQYCTDSLSIPKENSYIQKDSNSVPILTLVKSSTEQLHIPISISHHGYYGAFAIGPNRSLPA
ncbi:4'-phosphopantetheinyl transferase superfamily protein [Spirosoma sp. HMF4905]|uniref:4'-phosphopantetheinyl transferase superfamily protein n=1 Tax=Spirosoma arboris TaxID=2682092 RepID=A0A7K1S7B8_9BACT|nr:4'-phosphopantetheinyl transferase superfamily protein [Spirosoma arboris]MVM29707.1 4'-phosphopantetheinyl transferase superfamily protein [Spirosoma arboris]